MYMRVEEGGAEEKGHVRSLHSSTQDSIPDPEARSSLEITNLTLFTISDQHIDTISSLHSAYGGIKTTHMLKERKIHTMKNTEIWSCFASCPKLARIQLVL